MTIGIRDLPDRRSVFFVSLQRHGFLVSSTEVGIPRERGVIIPTTEREGRLGIDFRVKMPGKKKVFPIHVAQRGTSLYRRYAQPTPNELEAFAAESKKRLASRHAWCKEYAVAFVLVRDCDRLYTGKEIAWSDVCNLKRAIKELKRRL